MIILEISFNYPGHDSRTYTAPCKSCFNTLNCHVSGQVLHFLKVQLERDSNIFNMVIITISLVYARTGLNSIERGRGQDAFFMAATLSMKSDIASCTRCFRSCSSCSCARCFRFSSCSGVSFTIVFGASIIPDIYLHFFKIINLGER